MFFGDELHIMFRTLRGDKHICKRELTSIYQEIEVVYRQGRYVIVGSKTGVSEGEEVYYTRLYEESN